MLLPMFFVAEQQHTGIKPPLIMPCFRPETISSGVSSSPSKNFSSSTSSDSAANSIKLLLKFSTSSCRSAGISTELALPLPSLLNSKAFICMRSTIPLKSSCSPSGRETGTSLRSRVSFIASRAFWKSALSLSILLTHIMTGRPEFLIMDHTFCVCGFTGFTASTTNNTLSAALMAALASARKLSSPGVSIR